MNFINIGFGNFADADKIVAVASPNSAPMKRIMKTAQTDARVINATYGRRCQSLLICDNNSIYLSAVQPETIIRRVHRNANLNLLNSAKNEDNTEESPENEENEAEINEQHSNDVY